jgi:signal transduction histidine kinase
VLVVLVALVVAGGIFVVIRRNNQEQHELNRVIARSPVIYAEFSYEQRRGKTEADLAEFVHLAADEFNVRVLLVDMFDGGKIAEDSDGDLTGAAGLLDIDDLYKSGEQPVRGLPYVTWRPSDDSPGSDVVLVSAVPGRLGNLVGAPARSPERYWIVLAVSEATVREAWRGLIGGLLVAGAIAIPAAALLGALVAQYIATPLRRLTFASRRMAEGHFDVDVAVDRRDEVGRLSQAFSAMSSRVGSAQTQMRQLIANVSHDLKTPLTSILGFAQALRDGNAGSDAEVRRMGTVIHDEASRLTARLNDLLLLSEIESGQSMLQREEIDLQKLIEGVVGRFRPELDARRVVVTLDLVSHLTVSADAAKLERALENLIDNARKYAPDGGELRISAKLERDAVVVEIANSAPDVDAEELPKLFDRFYRRERARAQGNGGTGLGLPIARELVELHGGTLVANARDGMLVLTARLPDTAPER